MTVIAETQTPADVLEQNANASLAIRLRRQPAKHIAAESLRERLKMGMDRGNETDQTASFITDYHRRLPKPCSGDCHAIGLRQQLEAEQHAHASRRLELDICTHQLENTRLALVVVVSAAMVGLMLMYSYVTTH